MIDATLCFGDARATEIRGRVERWALDDICLEVASGHDTTHMRAGWQANAYLFALDLLMTVAQHGPHGGGPDRAVCRIDGSG